MRSGNGTLKPARGHVALPQQRCQQRKPLAGHRRMAFVRLVVEADAGAPQTRTRRPGRHCRENHCCHQSSLGLIRFWLGRSSGSSLRPSLRSTAAMHSGLAIGVNCDSNSRDASIPSQPPPPPGSRRRHRRPRRSHNLVAGRHPDRKVRMLHLESAQPPGQPGVGEGVGGGDREQRFIFLAMACERGFDRIEGAGQGAEASRAPSGVSRARPFSRTNKGAPSRSSRLSPDRTRPPGSCPSSAAAAVKFSVRAAASKARIAASGGSRLISSTS